MDSTMIVLKSPQSTTDIPPLRRWTVAEYHRLSQLGIFQAEERTELIDGTILVMVAKGSLHTTTLRLLAARLQTALGSRALICTQDPITLDNHSEPEPDLVVVQGTVWDYATRHPNPNEIELIVEIADSTLSYDLSVKAQTYSYAGIQEYWVMDITGQTLYVHRDPSPAGYGVCTRLSAQRTICPLAFPEIELTLQEVLPPSVS